MQLRARLLVVLMWSAYPLLAQQHWVASWTTAQPLIRNQPLGPRPVAAQNDATSAPRPAAPLAAGRSLAQQGLNNQTVRMIVHTSVGGAQVRVKLSNPFGGIPVAIGDAHIALLSKDAEIDPSSEHALTFNAKPGCTIGPGMVILSDAVSMAVPAQSDVAVSVYFPGETGPPAAHNGCTPATFRKKAPRLEGLPESTRNLQHQAHGTQPALIVML